MVVFGEVDVKLRMGGRRMQVDERPARRTRKRRRDERDQGRCGTPEKVVKQVVGGDDDGEWSDT